MAVLFCEFENGRCVRCNRRRPKTDRDVVAKCRESPAAWETLEDRMAYVHCRHRGRVLTTLDARTAGCGCSSTDARVYECERFHEPVLIQAAVKCLEKIRRKVSAYTGLTCWGCKVPADEMRVTERSASAG